MRKSYLVILSALLGLFVTTSCGSKSDSDELEFATLTVEQNKQKLEDDAVNTMGEMDEMGDLSVLDVISDFFDLADSDPYYASAQFMQNRINTLQSGNRALRSAELDTTISLNDLFNDNSGIYEWSETTKDFELTTESDDEVTFRFVMQSGDIAEMSIYGLSVIKTTDEDLADLTDDVPTAVEAHISIAGKKVFTYSFEARYYSDNMLKYHKEVITADNYSFVTVIDFTNNAVLKQSQSFKHNDYIILAQEFSVASNEDYDIYLDLMRNEESEDELSEDLINSANFKLQTGNIKLIGVANIKTILDKNDNIFNQSVLSQEDITLVNNNLMGYVMYADSKTLIAKTEFYNLIEDDEQSINMRIVFKDGSAINADFFNNGFEDLKTEIEQLENEIGDL